jgi:3-deoxy-7-phosphoheptulonate synthase
VTKAGHSAIVSTRGNPDCHVILRGGKKPNFDAASVRSASEELTSAGLDARVMIDLSHSNSRKEHMRQIEVGRDVAAQVGGGDRRIIGVMVESHLKAGRQDLKPGVELAYGQSITDACIGWDDTPPLLDILADSVRTRRRKGR